MTDYSNPNNDLTAAAVHEDDEVFPGEVDVALGGEPMTEAEAEQQENLDADLENLIEEAEAGGPPADANGESATEMTGQEIVVDSFGDLILPPDQVEALQQAWSLLITTAGSRENVGELLYNSFYSASSALESLFVTPRAVAAFRFFTGFNVLIANIGDPTRLRMHVESLANTHMKLDISVPRVNVIRDSLVDLYVVELQSKFTTVAAGAFVSMLNYVGGANIYIRNNFQERLQTLQSSWALANDESKNEERMATAEAGGDETEKGDGKGGDEAEGDKHNKKKDDGTQNIPTSFADMFRFNAAVMGFGQNLWMNEILDVFNPIMTNFAAVNRVCEECQVLTVRIAKVSSGKVNLGEFKSCMLASLRSLLPKDWTTAHEVAWSWAWDRMQGFLMEYMGKTLRWEKSLVDLIDSIDEATGYELRTDIYDRFFRQTPAGEAYFKQNVAYLHLLVTKMIGLCVNLYKDPVSTTDEISALGLRHVGYGIPTELFQPFVNVVCDAFRAVGAEEVSLQAFTWVIELIGQMMTRTITEGSTIVMKAINLNSAKAVKGAIACAARGVRAQWMLMITVGTRDISPFLWSVQSGAIEAAHAMLSDLVTIRADRDKYYYEVDYMFQRHPDIVYVFLQDAPGLLVPLFDGLIWRSRVTTGGYRRVNYYLKHLLIDPEEKFAKVVEWIITANDPKLMMHPMIVLLSDIIWNRVALRSFVRRKAWFLVTLVVFVVSQAVLQGLQMDPKDELTRYARFAFRVFIYCFSMGHMIFTHLSQTVTAFKEGQLTTMGKLKIPTYLATKWQDAFNLVLMLILVAMLCTEPIMYCLKQAEEDMLFADDCKAHANVRSFYYTVNMVAMVLYYVLLLDLAVLNNRVSAYVLVCNRMLSEVGLFVGAMLCVLLALSSGFSCLDQDDDQFRTIPSGFLAMWEMLLRLFNTDNYEALHDEPVVLVGVYFYLVISCIFLLNLLIAQLCCSYDAIYADMVGFARIKRCRIIVETMPLVSQRRWESFKESLALDEKIEFNEGDVGVAGGIQVHEPANVHPTREDTIKRVGGTTSPEALWPELDQDVENDKYAKLEALIKKAQDTVAAGGKGSGGSKMESGGAQSGLESGSGISQEGSGIEEEAS
eukprot:TRINITY_DN836_c0_g4_i1.p1 TRINITY_DN836_c0_g4~~TRINITY_DN836_c0_g4_i1.p1  ORF type:complete len:1114 (-),score=334.64 TRINITY_DN836_c0_g4_i1:325-3666(-)